MPSTPAFEGDDSVTERLVRDLTGRLRQHADSRGAGRREKRDESATSTHLGLSAASEEAFEGIRRRLVERAASDGVVDDLGAFRGLWFEDPDGMRVELTVVVDTTLRGIHEPRPLVETSS